MKNSIPIDNKGQYSLEELSDIVRVLLSDAENAYFEVEDLQLPREKMFEIIEAVLMHISEVSIGEFDLLKCSPQNYQLIYRENTAPPQKQKKPKETEKLYSTTQRQVAATALELESITGQLPEYAKREPYAALIAALKAERKKKSK